MAKKPNYSFERIQRERAKAEKQEAKRSSKALAATTDLEGRTIASSKPEERG